MEQNKLNKKEKKQEQNSMKSISKTLHLQRSNWQSTENQNIEQKFPRNY